MADKYNRGQIQIYQIDFNYSILLSNTVLLWMLTKHIIIIYGMLKMYTKSFLRQGTISTRLTCICIYSR